MVFPDGIKCIVCDCELDRESRLCVCPRCFLKQNTSFCLHCGRFFAGEAGESLSSADISKAGEYIKNQVGENSFCKECGTSPPPFDFARSPYVYEDKIVELVYRFKYGNAQYLAEHFAQHLLDVYLALGFKAKEAPNVLTFVPMAKKRKKSRGYNQAELLAKALASLVGLEIKELLHRKDLKINAAKMTREERLSFIKDSISIAAGADVKKKRVLLIDDVLTTAATTGECAKKLKQAGADKVFVLTFATAKAFV